MVTDTAPFRDPNHHCPTDLPEHVDFARLARVIDGIDAVVAKLAAGQEPEKTTLRPRGAGGTVPHRSRADRMFGDPTEVSPCTNHSP